MKFLFGFAASAVVFCFSLSAATYSGNGNSGFGGPIGSGSLTLTDGGTTIFGTVNKGPNGFNDVLLLYIDSSAGGFSYTSGFADGAVSQIGITPNSGATFSLLGTYTSNSGFLSDEAVAGNDVGLQGWNPFLQTAFGTYSIVPEPSILTLFGLAALSGLICLRRKK